MRYLLLLFLPLTAMAQFTIEQPFFFQQATATPSQPSAKFVALRYNSNAGAVSEDGTNWYATTLPITANWFAVGQGNGLFIACVVGGNALALSKDGTNWFSGSTITGVRTWEDIRYMNNRWVMIATDGQTGQSFDGTNWFNVTVINAVEYVGITFGANRYFALCGTSNPNRSAWSADATNWNEVNIGSVNGWGSAQCDFGNSTFVSVAGSDGPKAAYSSTATNWSAASSIAYHCNHVKFGNGLFVATTQNESGVLTSSDGNTWYSQTTPSAGVGQSWKHVAYSGGVFVITSYTDKALSSTDGTNWVSHTLPSSGTWWAAYGKL